MRQGGWTSTQCFGDTECDRTVSCAFVAGCPRASRLRRPQSKTTRIRWQAWQRTSSATFRPTPVKDTQGVGLEAIEDFTACYAAGAGRSRRARPSTPSSHTKLGRAPDEERRASPRRGRALTDEDLTRRGWRRRSGVPRGVREPRDVRTHADADEAPTHMDETAQRPVPRTTHIHVRWAGRSSSEAVPQRRYCSEIREHKSQSARYAAARGVAPYLSS